MSIFLPQNAIKAYLVTSIKIIELMVQSCFSMKMAVCRQTCLIRLMIVLINKILIFVYSLYFVPGFWA